MVDRVAQGSNILFAYLGSQVFTARHFAHGDSRVLMKHGTGLGRAQSNMNLANAGACDEGGRTVRVDARSGYDCDAVIRGFHQSRDCLNALKAGLFASGSEDAVGACGIYILERAKQIVCHVERAMECDREWPGGIDELTRAIDIDLAGWCEDAENDAISL